MLSIPYEQTFWNVHCSARALFRQPWAYIQSLVLEETCNTNEPSHLLGRAFKLFYDLQNSGL